MTVNDLIHLKGKGDSRSDEIRARTFGSSSEKRKVAQQISGLSRMKPENLEKRALSIISNPKTSALMIAKLLTKLIERKDLSDSLKIQLLNSACKVHNTIFGEQKMVSINTDFDEMLRLWRESREKIKNG